MSQVTHMDEEASENVFQIRISDIPKKLRQDDRNVELCRHAVLQCVAVCCNVLQCVAVPIRTSDKNKGAELRRDDCHADLRRHAARRCQQKSPISLPKSHIFSHPSPVSLPKEPCISAQEPHTSANNPSKEARRLSHSSCNPPPPLLQGGSI